MGEEDRLRQTPPTGDGRGLHEWTWLSLTIIKTVVTQVLYRTAMVERTLMPFS